MGDFNDIRYVLEKSGGGDASISHMRLFNDMIDSCSHLKLPFMSPKFTWCNKRLGSARILESLDRILVSIDFVDQFLSLSCSHLPNTYSNHYSLYMSLMWGMVILI